MAPFFQPTREEIEALDRLTDDIPEIQQVLVRNHDQLQAPDRTAHQQQIAGGRVTLSIAKDLPPELRDLGLFQSSTTALPNYNGIGRISTGMGCPHLETDPDFLGIMLAFRAGGRRIDFLGINDPTAPTNTVRDFLSLLRATADSAGTEVPFGSAGELHLGNLASSQVPLAKSLVEHAGLANGLGIFGHVANQTKRTLLSSSAVQQYWTGVVRANDTLGKFTIVPQTEVNQRRSLSPGANYLTEDWKMRQSAADLEFRLYWIAFRSPKETPLDELMKPWEDGHRVEVGTVVFPKVDAATREARLTALLASEMGANPGNWVAEKSEIKPPELPATEFTAGRFLAYRKSQKGRNVLPEERYESFFENGQIDHELAAELIARYNQKRAAGHYVPSLGEF
jgi:hypothetical protein